jgi:hypothetical protein
MAARSTQGRRELPTAVPIAVLVIMLAIIGFIAYRQFAPPPDPVAGLTPEQQAQKMRAALEEVKNRPPSTRRHGRGGLIATPGR